MSYTSESTLKRSATISEVRQIVELLGYRQVHDGFRIPNRVAEYFWLDDEDYRSWYGVELGLYKSPKGPIKVTTRSTIARSFWDLTHQNKTIKMLRDLFGGHFVTDAGKNRCWKPKASAPSPVCSGCYLARWRLNNNLVRAHVYLMNRDRGAHAPRTPPSGLRFLDENNPRLISNNLLLPYLIAIWEEYFRSTFVACLKYSKQREGALKRAKLSHAHLEELAIGASRVEEVVASYFHFQRPSAIAECFKLLDPKLDLAAPLRKPYRRRKLSLYESMETLVETRNEFVHSGNMDLSLSDAKLKTIISDLVVAVDRTYQYIGNHFGFTPITRY